MLTKKQSLAWFYGMVFLSGLVMLGTALQPFAKAAWLSYVDEETQAIYPLEIEEFVARMETGPVIMSDLSSLKQKAPVIVDDLRDYGNIENWFAGGTKNIKTSAQTQEAYTLAIEKLGVTNALVKMGGNNIDLNLVHFNPEVEVGGYGAPVIFGHSMLRQFYNPKETNKDRYKSIFSMIMTLEIGDEIKVKVGELSYTYLVTEKKEVDPDDEYILAQNTSKRQIKLVTCVPEGTYLRRGVITAELKL
jgi:sortase A